MITAIEQAVLENLKISGEREILQGIIDISIAKREFKHAHQSLNYTPEYAIKWMTRYVVRNFKYRLK